LGPCACSVVDDSAADRDGSTTTARRPNVDELEADNVSIANPPNGRDDGNVSDDVDHPVRMASEDSLIPRQPAVWRRRTVENGSALAAAIRASNNNNEQRRRLVELNGIEPSAS
jgi:hypothetical protein